MGYEYLLAVWHLPWQTSTSTRVARAQRSKPGVDLFGAEMTAHPRGLVR